MAAVRPTNRLAQCVAMGALVVLAGCLEGAGGVHSIAPDQRPAPTVMFGKPVVVSAGAPANEPGLAAGPDGAWYVCAPKGIGKGTDVWRSLDGGLSFTYSGTPVTEGAVVLRSGAGDAGGGDCDIAADHDGGVYLADLWAGSVSLSESRDRASSWTGVPLTIVAPPVDRPWVAAGQGGSILVTAAQLATTGYDEHGLAAPAPGGIWLARSTDSGRTFQQSQVASNDRRTELNGNVAQGPDGTLYIPYTLNVTAGRVGLMMALSHDEGLTWQHHLVAQQAFPPRNCGSLNIFPSVAVDAHGLVLLTWVLDNAATGRLDLFVSTSQDAGQHWMPPAILTERAGTRLFPWAAASPRGNGVGIAWYEANQTMRYAYADTANLTCNMPGSDQADWFVHYAFVARDGDALRVRETLVQPEPVHHGSLDRPYAERLGVAIDDQGRAGVAYVADVPEGAARPMFALEARGNGATPAPGGVHDSANSAVSTMLTEAMPATSYATR